MANIKFYLHRYKPTGDTQRQKDPKEFTIYFRYRLGREVDFRAPIGRNMKVTPDDWNEEKQEVRSRAHLSTIAATINSRIKRLAKAFEDYDLDNIRLEFRPNYEDVKAFFKSLEKKSDTKKAVKIETGLFKYIDDFIKVSKTAINPHTGFVVSESTIRTYVRTRTILKEYNDTIQAIDFENINMKFYARFLDFCNKKNLGYNYTGQHIKTIRTFMNNAVEDGVTTHAGHKAKGFIVLKEEVDTIYLNLGELDRIFKLDLSKMPQHERARDLFILGAFTGLRVSDYNQLHKGNISQDHAGNTLITVRTQKTGEKVSIPARPEVLHILKKNDGKPPRRMTEQEINRYIKEVGQIAGLDEERHVTATKGGVKRTVKKFKFELIMTHTARRSFLTNAYLAGVPTISLMKISGHRTEKAFLTYIKVSPEENATHMASHPFFKTQGVLKMVV